MSNFTALVSNVFINRKWIRFNSWKFSTCDDVAVLVAHEFGKACVNLSIAFIWQGERFLPVAVQGVDRNVNLFVDPDGRWLGGIYTCRVSQLSLRVGAYARSAIGVVCGQRQWLGIG